MPTKKVTAKKVTKPAAPKAVVEETVVEETTEPAASHRGLSPRLRYQLRRLGR